MDAANGEQSEFWQELAPNWLASVNHTELVSGPFGIAAMESLSLGAGQHVLDVGCGDGSTTLELARRVGPGGTAVGVDIAPAMLDAARARAAAEGIDNASFVVADAQTEGLGSSEFDAGFSRFGVMFFADPVAAFVNIRKSLRPGGAFAFACWDNVFANEWMFLPASAVVEVTGSLPPMPGPAEPGPFSLADPDRAASVLGEAGFTSVTVTALAHPVELPEGEIESLVSLSQRVGPLREALRTADADTSARLVDSVRATLMARVEGGLLSLSAAALIVRAYA
jgi:ubiquinone/menaquinone biosynthesis C-methylase UbiE